MADDNRATDYRFSDFTESEFRDLLRLVKAKWRLISFPDYKSQGAVCLWRHDLDFSPQRALKLAEMEAEEGVKATYFVHLHSEFYTALERANVDTIRRILSYG